MELDRTYSYFEEEKRKMEQITFWQMTGKSKKNKKKGTVGQLSFVITLLFIGTYKIYQNILNEALSLSRATRRYNHVSCIM